MSPIITPVYRTSPLKSSHRSGKVIHRQIPKMALQSPNHSMPNATCHFFLLFATNWNSDWRNLNYVFFLISFHFLTRKLLGHMRMLPSILLVACHQGEVIIDADSQAGCDLLSIAELSSQHLAICYKFIQSFTSRYPWGLLMLLPLNAYNNYWQYRVTGRL